MNTVIEFLRGKKTYILTGLGVLVVLLNLFGVIDSSNMLTILSGLGFASVAALRDAISNLGSK